MNTMNQALATVQQMYQVSPVKRRASKPAPKPAIEVGTKVRVPALGICGKLVAVQPSQTLGGVTRYRIGWLEAAAQGAYREAGFWLEDIEVVAAKSR